MANMTRDEMVTELQARGWSRFTAAQVQRYLDWGLQDIYARSSYPRSVMGVTTVAGFTGQTTPFTTLSGAGAELVHKVVRVLTLYSTEIIELLAADEDYFWSVMWPNSQKSSPDKGAHPTHYYVHDLLVYTYPQPHAAVTLYIHHLLREDVFSGGTDTTGLPERFDKAVIAAAEVHCARRARDVETMGLAQAMVDQFILDELGQSSMQMAELTERIDPWRG